MAENSKIEWTDHTWNPWMGCTKVSDGCKNCYMFREQKRYGHNPLEVKRTSKHTFNKPIQYNDGPALVFVCSWSDFFHPLADQWRDDAWNIIKRCQDLTFQILTKRPERIKDHLPKDWPEKFLHVWLGVSVEDQSQIHRVTELVETDALVKFVSAEPLIGPLVLDNYLPELDWVIVGGESGPGHREMEMDWARDLLNHCKFYKVPLFFKQIGGWPNKGDGDKAKIDGQMYHEMPHTWTTPLLCGTCNKMTRHNYVGVSGGYNQWYCILCNTKRKVGSSVKRPVTNISTNTVAGNSIFDIKFGIKDTSDKKGR